MDNENTGSYLYVDAAAVPPQFAQRAKRIGGRLHGTRWRFNRHSRDRVLALLAEFGLAPPADRRPHRKPRQASTREVDTTLMYGAIHNQLGLGGG